MSSLRGAILDKMFVYDATKSWYPNMHTICMGLASLMGSSFLQFATLNVVEICQISLAVLDQLQSVVPYNKLKESFTCMSYGSGTQMKKRVNLTKERTPYTNDGRNIRNKLEIRCSAERNVRAIKLSESITWITIFH